MDMTKCIFFFNSCSLFLFEHKPLYAVSPIYSYPPRWFSTNIHKCLRQKLTRTLLPLWMCIRLCSHKLISIQKYGVKWVRPYSAASSVTLIFLFTVSLKIALLFSDGYLAYIMALLFYINEENIYQALFSLDVILPSYTRPN